MEIDNQPNITISHIAPDFGGFNIVVGSTQLKPRFTGNFAW